jgi:NAD dependent epimerase/dehydratase family enzyme
MRFLIENPTAQGAYNSTAPEPVTNREFARLLGRVLHRPSFIPLPAFVFRLLFGEVSTVVLEGQRVFPTRLQQAGYPFKFEALEPALRDLLNK